MSTRYVRTALGFAIIASGAILSVACGSSDDGSGDNATGSGVPGQPTDGTVTGLGIGNAGTGGSLGPGTSLSGGMHDGGTVDLTADQVSAVASAACAGWEGEGQYPPAVLQLVVDVSGSMTQLAASTNLTKWEPIRRRILLPVSTMPWRGSWARSWRR